MNPKKTALLIATCLFFVAAFAGDKMHHKVAIEIAGSGDDGDIRIVLDSDDLGFSLHDLQIGEKRSIVDKEDRSVVITRTEEGFTFDVDGKTISLPAFDGPGEDHVWSIKGDHMSDVDIHVLHDGMNADSAHLDGVMIFSGKEIDAATQDVIRSALESTGHSNVQFVADDEGGRHHVRVIKKVLRE
ncbi:MAG: hypothetical protein IIB75_02950 [Proteobacteria bacterium]|nr:hypothetical protein [Pseudomonadota bacterium]